MKFPLSPLSTPQRLLTGNMSKLQHHLTTPCSSSSPLLKTASLNKNTKCHPRSENFINIARTYTQLTVLSSTKTGSSYHAPSLRPSCLTSLHAAHQGTSSMISKAATSIFWPGITNDIQVTRANCLHCNRMAPSQAALPPIPPILPVYPFQCICADYIHYHGHHYLVIVDRYSNWPIVERAKEGAQGLVNVLRHTFATYGIPDELSSDGGPEFVANVTGQFLRVHHRLSSVAFPYSNCRAEVGVKTVKRLITGNVGRDGSINVDSFQRAILQYRNTPDPTTKLSPAMCIFGRPTMDLIPILPGKYQPHQTWKESLLLREEALRRTSPHVST